MLSVRKVKAKSGALAVQVVVYQGHKAKIIKHIGSSKDEEEVSLLYQKAREYIKEYSGQSSLFPETEKKILFVEHGECIGVTHQFARNFLLCCVRECGLSDTDELLLDLSIMRLLEPVSKLRTIMLLKHYFGINYSQRIYRKIPKLVKLKKDIERRAYSVAVKKFNEQFYFVLYDVTTLYFETFNSDELRIPGFSKDNKPQQPQVVIGLLVTQSGFPLSYEVFSGNTFEGKKMLPIIEEFISEHKQTKPIVVADAAMLSEERLKELKQKKISYIVGARLSNTNLGFIKKIHNSLKDKEGVSLRFPSIHGDLICDFSTKRYNKQLNDLNKQIKKAEELVSKNSSGKRVKFVKKLSEEMVELNKPLIEKHKLLLGIKGYCTDIAESDLSNEEVIARYHNLWRVEQSFRMSKTDLETRPIFHYKEEAIRAHVLICFVALIIEKYLELSTNLSIRKIRDLIWDITETHIHDKLTKKVFIFYSPTKDIMNSPLTEMIVNWKLLPH
ncbi:MAG TPA: IS1634 family transposase [Ignavibacteriaceae bacterium]|nr:IS1634 family transposase [Ignavibacteriaceae bacterium]